MSEKFKKNLQYYKFCFYGFLKNQKFYEPFFLLFLLSKDISYLGVGILYSIREITINVLEIPAGILSDAWGRRRSMIISFIFYIISFILFYFASSFTLLVAAIVIFGFADVFRTGTHKAMIFQYLEINGWSDQKVDYYGHTRSWSQLGSSVSSILAALIVIVSDNYSAIFLFGIIPYLLNLLNISSYPSYLDGEKSRVKPSEVWIRIKDTFITLARSAKDKAVLRLFVNSSIISAYFKSVKDYLQPLLLSFAISIPLVEGLGSEDRTSVVTGVVYSLIFILTAIASRRSGNFLRRAGQLAPGLNITYLVVLVSGLLAGLLFHFDVKLIAIIFFICLYLAENLRRPVAIAAVSENVDKESLATYLSVDSQMKSLFAIIFSPIIGYLADKLSPGASIMILAALLLLVYPLTFVRRNQ